MAKDTLISHVIQQNEHDQYYKNFKFDFSDRILKEHNKETYKKIIEGFSTGNKVLFEQATGTGKSYLALTFLYDNAQSKRVLFVSPSKAIKDSFINLYEKWLGNHYCKLDTCLYQGLNSKQNKHYDVIIFDEAHRMGAKVWGPNAEVLMNNNPNANILGMTATLDRPDGVDVMQYFDNKEPVSRITFVEALGKGILPKPDYTLAKFDFNDDLKFIDTCIKDFNKKLKSAEGEDKKSIQEFLQKLNRAKQIVSKSKDIPQIFAEKITSNELKQGKFIVFCPAGEDEDENKESIHRMKNIMKQAPKWFQDVEGIKKIKKYSVYSKLGSKKNGKIIDAFERDNTKALKLLFSINMLNEGVHLDDIDGVIMLRTTNSRIVYLQQLGRALSVGHKHQPKIFDLVANLNYVDITAIQKMATDINNLSNRKVLNGANFNIYKNEPLFKLNIDNLDTLQLIDTLKTNIYVYNHQNTFTFDDFFKRMLEYKDKYGDLSIPIKYVCEDGYKLGAKCRHVRSGDINLSKEQKDQLNSIGFIWDASIKFDFDRFYQELKKYKFSYGDMGVPVKYVCEDGFMLGAKAAAIRSEKLKLSEEQIDKLNSIGFIWDATIKFDFDRFYQELKAYKIKYGDLTIPVKYESEDGYILGLKAASIRSGSIKLSKDQKEQLNSIGFVWNTSIKFDFDRFYKELKEYKTKYKDMGVPVKYVCDDGYMLGVKAASIRSGKLKVSEEQTDKLNSIGFVWDTSIKFDFDRFYKELKEYKTKYEDMGIPVKYVCDDGYMLGAKAASIRSGNLKVSEEQKEQLNSIGFIWDATIKFDFDRFYQELKAYKIKYGDLSVPTKYICENGYKLGAKAKFMRKGITKLSKEQKEQLNSIGFIWDASIKFDFDRFYQELKKYKSKYGDLIIPVKYECEDEYKLGSKVARVRSGNVELSKEQKEQIDSIGFIWNTKKFDFDKFYEKLKEYKIKYGNLFVPAKYECEDGDKLGTKCRSVRSRIINLSEEQIEKLNSIGFVWHVRSHNIDSLQK